MATRGRGVVGRLRACALACLCALAWTSGPLFAATVVRLSWDANPESDLAGYRLRYGTSPGVYTQVQDAGTATSSEVWSLDPGTTYYFVVHAFDLAGNESPASNSVSARPVEIIGPRPTVSLTDSPDPIAAGGNVTYTISYANTGDEPATNVRLSDGIPANTSFVSATGGGTLAGGVVTWNLGILAAGASGSVQLTVRVASPLTNGTVITNGTCTIDSSETTPVTAAVAGTTVTSSPALALSQADSPDPVTAGSNLTYTIAYLNSGTAHGSGVVITAQVPANTTFRSATAGGVLSGSLVTWSIGSLPVGTSGSVQLVVRVSGTLAVGSVITSDVCRIDSNETAPLSAATATTTVAAAPAPIVSTAVEAATNSHFIVQSGRHSVRVTGLNFMEDAVLTLGSGIVAGPTSLVDSDELTVTIDVASTATLGPRTLGLTNPDGRSGSKVDALAVVKTSDIVPDCLIDGTDLNTLARAWNTRSGETGYVDAADLDGDGYVGPVDLTIFGEFFGQRLTVCP